MFQSTFIGILSPGASIFVNLCWTLLNSGVALIGYYCAAAVVDNRYIGRLRLQALGFFMVVSTPPRLLDRDLSSLPAKGYLKLVADARCSLC